MTNFTGQSSEMVAVGGTGSPISLLSTAVSTDWVSMINFPQVLAVIAAGTIADGGVVEGKLQQASDSSGTGVKDITGKAIVDLADTADNTEQLINCNADELDIANSFNHVRLTITESGGFASLACGLVLGVRSLYPPANQNDVASVTQIIT